MKIRIVKEADYPDVTDALVEEVGLEITLDDGKVVVVGGMLINTFHLTFPKTEIKL